MPTQRSRANDRGEGSRLPLLEATLRLAGERGYVGTTMARITRATGLPASSVYWHFGSKDQLIAEAVAHGFEVWREHATPWSTMDASLPRPARLARRAGHHRARHRRPPRLLADGPAHRPRDRSRRRHRSPRAVPRHPPGGARPPGAVVGCRARGRRRGRPRLRARTQARGAAGQAHPGRPRRPVPRPPVGSHGGRRRDAEPAGGRVSTRWRTSSRR